MVHLVAVDCTTDAQACACSQRSKLKPTHVPLLSQDVTQCSENLKGTSPPNRAADRAVNCTQCRHFASSKP